MKGVRQGAGGNAHGGGRARQRLVSMMSGGGGSLLLADLSPFPHGFIPDLESR